MQKTNLSNLSIYPRNVEDEDEGMSVKEGGYRQNVTLRGRLG